MSKMSPDDWERFEKLSHLQSELSAVGEEQLFSCAFTLSLLLAADVANQAEAICGA